MIDKINSFKNNKSITCTKKLKKNEWFYKHHLIGRPMMPGVLQEETMLQSVMLLFYLNKNNQESEFLLYKTNSTFFSEIKGSAECKIYSNIKKIAGNFISVYSYIEIKKQKKSSGNFIVIKKKNEKL